MSEINKTISLSPSALAVIDAYRNFKLKPESYPISIPYFNNRRHGLSTGLRVLIGKGTPKDIKEEIEIREMQEKLAIFNSSNSLNDKPESLKKYMWEHNIGIDCSGYAYAILEEENKIRGYAHLKNHLSFPFIKSFLLRVIKSKIRAVENTDVRTFAHQENSIAIDLKDVHPGDFISMIDASPREKNQKAHDHIILIYAVDYIDNNRPENLKNSVNQNTSQNELIPQTLYYTHSIARPEDGEWNHGVRNGKIIIKDLSLPIMQAEWLEEKVGAGATTGIGSGDVTGTGTRAGAGAGKSVNNPENNNEGMHTPNWVRQYNVDVRRLAWWK